VLAPDKKAQDALRKAAEAERKSTATAGETNEVSETNDVSETNGVGEIDDVSQANQVGDTDEAIEINEDHEPIDDELVDPAEASVASEPAAPQAGDQ